MAQKPAAASFLSSMKTSSSEIAARGGFGEKKCLGRGRVEKEEKREKKDAQRKGGLLEPLMSLHCILVDVPAPAKPRGELFLWQNFG